MGKRSGVRWLLLWVLVLFMSACQYTEAVQAPLSPTVPPRLTLTFE